ncbi:MAG: hypothetical protein QXR17_05435 [Candidatus Bathyarchaeia archaeon]
MILWLELESLKVTRHGMKTPEMLRIAELIKRAVDGENPKT